jgi:hypothetical protein
VTAARYLGVHMARVKLASRHIQECASLGLVDEVAYRRPPGAAAVQTS